MNRNETGVLCSCAFRIGDMGEGLLPPPMDMDSVEMLDRDAALSHSLAFRGLVAVSSGTTVHYEAILVSAKCQALINC